jgi:lactate 2-monooxygenase
MKKIAALERQRAVYVKGFSGQKPLLPVDVAQLESNALGKIRPEAAAYIRAGAGTEKTPEFNRAAFDKHRLVPRVLRDVSARNMGAHCLGLDLPTPIVLSPIGVLEMAHKQADMAVAKAAHHLGIPFIFSNQASVPMEATAREMRSTPYFFQLYWSKSNDLVASFVERAEACGCKGIVVTLDTFLLGWRTRDLDLAYLPFLEGMGIAQYTSDPVFKGLLEQSSNAASESIKPRINLTTLRKVLRLKARMRGNLPSGRELAAVRQFINIYSRDSLAWEQLGFLRKHTSLPIILKGILHPDDARRAIDEGVDGIFVSNHGGRQLDGEVAALDALPRVAEAVNGQAPVIFDSGIRTGTDIFKALALGANLVGIGRPYVYGLALAGEAGVREVLVNLLSEFDLTMGLMGCNSLQDIQPSVFE